MLLDTHVVLWLLDDSPRLGVATRERIARESAAVSAVSLWELAIKSSLGKISVPDDLPQLIEESGLELLDVRAGHAWGVREMRGVPHRDPFDAMLVTQAQQEGLDLVTADEQLLQAASGLTVGLVDARR